MNEFHSLEDAFSYVRILQKPILPSDLKPHKIWKPKLRQRIDGGDPVRTPIDRVAARVVAPAPWWAKPPETIKKDISNNSKQQKKSKTKKNNKMKSGLLDITIEDKNINIPNQTSVSASGVKIHRINGEDMFRVDEMEQYLCEAIAKLPKETRPNVKAAEDARRIIQELLQGIGGEMEKFRADTKRYLEDIRATRFAVVTETSQMTGALKDVRQFFLGSDYKEEILRLKEFVDLCERLNSLKESGFLDNVADTILRLSK